MFGIIGNLLVNSKEVAQFHVVYFRTTFFLYLEKEQGRLGLSLFAESALQLLCALVKEKVNEVFVGMLCTYLPE